MVIRNIGVSLALLVLTAVGLLACGTTQAAEQDQTSSSSVSTKAESVEAAEAAPQPEESAAEPAPTTEEMAPSQSLPQAAQKPQEQATTGKRSPADSVKSDPFPTAEELGKMGMYESPWGWGEYRVNKKWLIQDGVGRATDLAEAVLMTFWRAGVNPRSYPQSPLAASADKESVGVAETMGAKLVIPEKLNEYGIPSTRKIYAVKIEPGEFHGVEVQSVENRSGKIKYHRTTFTYSAIITVDFAGEEGRESFRLLAEADNDPIYVFKLRVLQ